MRSAAIGGVSHLSDGDEIINDMDLAYQMNSMAICSSGDCPSMPRKQKVVVEVINFLCNSTFCICKIKFFLINRYIMMKITSLVMILLVTLKKHCLMSKPFWQMRSLWAHKSK